MSSSLGSLLTSRRFAPLFVTQFLGAFNDNLLKSALGIYVTFALAAQSGMKPGTLVMLTGAIFIAPFFLFSGASGTFADRTDKAVIARWVKIVEIGIMAAGAAGLYFSSLTLLFIAIFALGTHSTVFGPIKYALLPQHLHEDELVAGNALIEAGTFLSILCGTIVGGTIALLGQGPLIIAAIGCGGAAVGWLAARFIPPAPPTAGADAPRPRLIADSVSVVSHVTARPTLLVPVLAISWFWLFGATIVSGLPVFAKDVLFADEHVVTLMLALFALGVGLGSMLAERLLHGEVSGRHVPLGGIIMGAAAIDLGLASQGRAASATLIPVTAFIAAHENWRLLVDLVLLAMGGGLFTVPLYAVLQHESEPEQRARVIAANNIINAFFMTFGAVGAALLVDMAGLSMAQIFALCGLLTFPVVVYASWRLRRVLMRRFIRFLLSVLYRV